MTALDTSLNSLNEASRDRVIHVIQGSLESSDEPSVVLMTILGSCVATCLWDPEAQVGGMNHFLLASEPGQCQLGYRNGSHAMELLINSLLRKGAQRHRLHAKVFGGAMMQNKLGHIGKANGEFALHFLKAEGIAVMGQSLGGNMARRIRFRPSTGQAQQRLVSEEILPPPTPVLPIRTDITFFED